MASKTWIGLGGPTPNRTRPMAAKTETEIQDDNIQFDQIYSIEYSIQDVPRRLKQRDKKPICGF